jgi:F420-dependent oxidoreductase-like protein
MASPIQLPSPCMVVLVGVAGAGKSTWARANFEPHHIVSSDALRALVGEGEGDQAASKDAFAILDDVVRRRLRRSLTTVIDTLGMSAERRAVYRQIAAEHGVPCIAVVIEVDAARARRQNRSRVKRVPERVVDEHLASWAAAIEPLDSEGFSAVHRVAPDVRPALAPEPPQGQLAPDESPAAAAVLVPANMIRERRQEPANENEAKEHEPAERQAPGPERQATRPATLRFGLQIPRFAGLGGPAAIGPALAAIAGAAERAGFESIWVMDHFRQIPLMGRAWEDMPESYTTLAHLAAHTSTIRLGTLVSGITYRNVAHLAKIVATLDVLSGGRANCGLGLGWFRQEHEAYGWPFPTVAERYALLEDALRLLPAMWGPGTKPFTGRVLSVPETMCYPRPLQERIPILVGGSGERRTLRLVAQHADACNLFGEAAQVVKKVAVLRRHCDELGRDPASVQVTQLSTVLVAHDHHELASAVERLKPPSLSKERYARSVNAGTVEQHIERLTGLAAAGVQTAIVSLAELTGTAEVEQFANVIAAFAG